jgi:phosphoglycerate dehydrogenase-like enzyme
VGEIGARTARLASALGMRVLGVRRDPSRAVPAVAEMHGNHDLLRLLPEADFVVLTVPLTRETEGMIGEAELRAMKESAYLVNIGRGGTVLEGDLARALEEGWIAGAGLDVFEEEPLPEDSPLWGMEKVIITSHYSGSTPHYDERALEIFLDNLGRYRSGRPLRNLVDKARGY